MYEIDTFAEIGANGQVDYSRPKDTRFPMNEFLLDVGLKAPDKTLKGLRNLSKCRE